MKKILALFVVLLIVPIVVFASVSSQVITMNLLSGGEIKTETYDFTYGYHYASVQIDQIKNKSYPAKMVIALNRKSLFDNEQKLRQVANIQEKTVFISNSYDGSSGKHYYEFGAYENAFSNKTTKGSTYSGVVSDQVILR